MSGFIKLSDRRVLGYMHLEMDSGAAYRHAPHYQYVEIPMRDLITGKAPRRVVKAGELVTLEATGTVRPDRCSIMVVVNPLLEMAGWCGYHRLVDSTDEGVIDVAFQPIEDFDLTRMTDNWLVRLYAVE